MEAQILQTLEEIRAVLFGIAAFAAVGVLFWIIRSVSIIVNQFDDKWRRKWRDDGEKYFERGEYDKLEKHCEEWLEKRPNSAMALWWLARVNFDRGDLAASRVFFERLLAVEPSWKEGSVDPYYKNGEFVMVRANNTLESDAD